MANTVENVVVCRATGNQANSTAPCTIVAAKGYAPVVVSALVLDPTTNLQSTISLVPFDYTQAAAAFSFGLTMVLTFWLAAKPIGILIGLVNRSR
jgi:hypothetical protein